MHGASLRIVNARRTHVKLREARPTPSCWRDPSWAGGGVASADADAHGHGVRAQPRRDDYVSADMAVPKLTLRGTRPICSRGQVVTSGGFVWPDTYRHHLAPRLRNYFVEEAARRSGTCAATLGTPSRSGRMGQPRFGVSPATTGTC